MGNYVDENLNAVNDKFQYHTNWLWRPSKISYERTTISLFFGTQMSLKSPETILLSQEHFVRTLDQLHPNCDVAVIGRSQYLLKTTNHNKPKFSCLVAKASWITKKTFSKWAGNDTNKGIHKS